MTSKLAVLCEICSSLAIDSPCECGNVATKTIFEPFGALCVFCDTHTSIVLVKVWIDDNGIISFFRRYKDIKTGKIVPFYIKKDKICSLLTK